MDSSSWIIDDQVVDIWRGRRQSVYKNEGEVKAMAEFLLEDGDELI